jgi:hypothetical protein
VNNTWVRTKTADDLFMTDDYYELLSCGDRGIVSIVKGEFVLDYDRLQAWVAESLFIGTNGIGFLAQAPWQSKSLIILSISICSRKEIIYYSGDESQVAVGI